MCLFEFCLRRLGVSPRPPYREGSAHGYTRAVPRCQGTSAGRSNLGVRHLAQRPARPSALAFGSQARRVCEQISNCTPFHAKLHTLSCEKISNCTPFQSLCGFFDKRGLCLLSKSKVAHVLLRNIMVTCFLRYQKLCSHNRNGMWFKFQPKRYKKPTNSAKRKSGALFY